MTHEPTRVRDGERRVLVIYTGGTIGMQRGPSGYVPVSGLLGRLLEQMPQFHEAGAPRYTTPPSQFGRRVRYDVREREVLLDSSNMGVEDWVAIAREIEASYDDYDAFVVLHGTDTMAYTASALSFMLAGLQKTVVLTGSQIPLVENRNDAVDNLLGALTIAGHYDLPEVGLYFHHALMRGNRTRKMDASGLDAFQSNNIPPLVRVGIGIEVAWHLVRRMPRAGLRVREITERNVAALRIFPGMTGEILRNFLQEPLRGLVIETYGTGNMPDTRRDLLDALREAHDRGVVIVNCTQCPRGLVTADYAAGRALREVGVVGGADMTPEAALTKLAYLLSQPELTPVEVEQWMQTDLRGEMTLRPAAPRFDLRDSRFVREVALALTPPSDAGHETERRVGEALYPVVMCAAANLGDVDTLVRLIEDGNTLDVTDYEGRTPLHVAAAAGQLAVCRLLLDEGARIDVADRHGRTPLAEAVSFGHAQIAALLRARGATTGGPPRPVR